MATDHSAAFSSAGSGCSTAPTRSTRRRIQASVEAYPLVFSRVLSHSIARALRNTDGARRLYGGRSGQLVSTIPGIATVRLFATQEARVRELAEKPLDVRTQHVHRDVVLALDFRYYRGKRGTVAQQVPNPRADVIECVEAPAGCIEDCERTGRTDR